MATQITIECLKNGTVVRVKPSVLAQLDGRSLATVYRKIRSGALQAIKDPSTGSVFIPAEMALAYLSGKPYKRDHQDKNAIARMETARAAKRK